MSKLKMKSLNCIVIVICFVVSSLIVNVKCKPNSKDYAIINDYLKKNVELVEGSNQELDPQLVIKVAMKMLTEQKTKNLVDYISPNSDNNRLIQALEQFIGLNKLFENENNCNTKMSELVKANKSCYGYSAITERLIDTVVEQMRRKLEKQCQSIMMIKYQQKLSTMTKSVVDQVKKALSPIIENYIEKHRNDFEPESPIPSNKISISRLFIIFWFAGHDDKTEIGNQENTLLAYKAILSDIEKDKKDCKLLKSSKRPINKETVRKLFKKYLLNQCSYYVNQLKDDLFDLAEETGALVPSVRANTNTNTNTNQNQSSQQAQNELLEYYYGWIRYKVCKELIAYGSKAMANDALKCGLFE